MQSFLLNLLVILILIAFNAVMAATEIALVSSRKSRLRAFTDEGNNSAQRVLVLASNPSTFLASIQFGVTFASFFASAFGAVTIADSVKRWLEEVPIDFIANNARGIALVGVTLILSYITIVFGELIPKTLAVTRAESFSLRIIRPLELLLFITK